MQRPQGQRPRSAKSSATIHGCAQAGDITGLQKQLRDNPSLVNERNPVVRSPLPLSVGSCPLKQRVSCLLDWSTALEFWAWKKNANLSCLRTDGSCLCIFCNWVVSIVRFYCKVSALLGFSRRCVVGMLDFRVWERNYHSEDLWALRSEKRRGWIWIQ